MLYKKFIASCYKNNLSIDQYNKVIDETAKCIGETLSLF
jgi:hypothetical protein